MLIFIAAHIPFVHKLELPAQPRRHVPRDALELLEGDRATRRVVNAEAAARRAREVGKVDARRRCDGRHQLLERRLARARAAHPGRQLRAAQHAVAILIKGGKERRNHRVFDATLAQVHAKLVERDHAVAIGVDPLQDSRRLPKRLALSHTPWVVVLEVLGEDAQWLAHVAALHLFAE